MKQVLYIWYSDDEYQLPEFVTDSLAELSRLTGKKRRTLSCYICKGYRAARITIDEQEAEDGEIQDEHHEKKEGMQAV